MKGAWVTLATNDSYSLGALVLAHSLKQVGTRQELAILVTPGVTSSMRERLAQVFNLIQEVNVLDSRDKANLRLLQRPELGITFTKLHCWRLTQYEKCVFLDADTLVLQNCDELFDREELSAAPDVGWPDCFNSGVFVYRPSGETYDKLIQFAIERGSFDGGDQGLLNLYFSDWAHKDISKHLPFIYNVCSTAFYSYLPAFKQFGKDVKIIHFIGNAKPWLQYFDTETQKVRPSGELSHLTVILQKWWDIFCTLIHPNLSADMSGLAGAFARLTLGQQRSPEQEALENSLRRQNWEQGNIDYLGKDSFDNIWSKICETLAKGPDQETSTAGETPDISEQQIDNLAEEQKKILEQTSVDAVVQMDKKTENICEGISVAEPKSQLEAEVREDKIEIISTAEKIQESLEGGTSVLGELSQKEEITSKTVDMEKVQEIVPSKDEASELETSIIPQSSAPILEPEKKTDVDSIPPSSDLSCSISQHSLDQQPLLVSQPAPLSQPSAIPESATVSQPAPVPLPASVSQSTSDPQPSAPLQSASISQPAPVTQPRSAVQPTSVSQPALPLQPALDPQAALVPQDAPVSDPAPQPAPVSQAAPVSDPAPQPAPVPQSAPASDPAPLSQPTVISQSEPVAKPTGISQSAPVSQPPLVPESAPASQPDPISQSAPVLQPTTIAQPGPVIQSAAVTQPSPTQPPLASQLSSEAQSCPISEAKPISQPPRVFEESSPVSQVPLESQPLPVTQPIPVSQPPSESKPSQVAGSPSKSSPKSQSPPANSKTGTEVQSSPAQPVQQPPTAGSEWTACPVVPPPRKSSGNKKQGKSKK